DRPDHRPAELPRAPGAPHAARLQRIRPVRLVAPSAGEPERPAPRRPRGAPRAAPEQRQPAGTAERSIALLGRPQLVRPGLPAAAGNGLAGVRLGGTAAPPGQQLRSPAADGAA